MMTWIYINGFYGPNEQTVGTWTCDVISMENETNTISSNSYMADMKPSQ